MYKYISAVLNLTQRILDVSIVIILNQFEYLECVTCTHIKYYVSNYLLDRLKTWNIQCMLVIQRKCEIIKAFKMSKLYWMCIIAWFTGYFDFTIP